MTLASFSSLRRRSPEWAAAHEGEPNGKAPARSEELHNPPQLSRLVVGKPPGATVKLCLRHWGIVILSSRVGLGEKPLREGCSPVVRHRVARAGQGDDDLVVQHFDMESLTRGSSFRPQPHPRRIAVGESLSTNDELGKLALIV